MNPKNLPLGINTLSMLRENNCVYVDKTEIAHRLIRIPGRFFLSRPRRFGKSLFVDTLKEIFEGNQKLFEGLYIYDQWDWSRKFPVIKIDFAGGVLKNRQELDQKINGILLKTAQSLGVDYELEDIQGRFGEIIAGAYQRFGERTVVLVDEYDKPILDNIDNPPIAAQMREGLKNLYSVLKEQDANLQFVFMTGVTKFSKVSLFSGVNQLTDITIDTRYSSICGYTETDLTESFGEHLAGVDREAVRSWYNGYNWTGSESVYNPYDILMFIDKRKIFRNYWFETGSPSFLVKLFQAKCYFGDVNGFISTVRSLFASIPWRNFTNNDLANFEGYYASVLYAFLSSLNARIIPEDITNYGQADITAILGDHVYVMEIKVVDGEIVKENLALKQIRECNYAQKYRGEPGKTVHEVGLVFSRSKRNLIQADWE